MLDLNLDCIWKENQPVNSVQLSEEKKKMEGEGEAWFWEERPWFIYNKLIILLI